MKDKRRDGLKDFALFGVSMLVSIGFLELALRLVLAPPIVWKYPQEQYDFDPEIGHWMRPNQRAFTHDKPVATNSAGIRDAEYAEESASDVYRILALGDSQTFGNGLDLIDTWPKQLESTLNSNSPSMGYEVINGGLPGSDTWQHEIILERMLPKYKPDAVILAFYTNDVVESFVPSDEARTSESKLAKQLAYLLKRSALLLSLRSAIQSVLMSVNPSPGYMQELAVVQGDDDPSLDAQWRQVETSLSNMARISNDSDVELIVAVLPRRDQVSGQLAWQKFHARIQAILSRHRIPAVLTIEPLQQSFDTYGPELFIPWDGHNSARR